LFTELIGFYGLNRCYWNLPFSENTLGEDGSGVLKSVKASDRFAHVSEIAVTGSDWFLSRSILPS
jgi:hypothetical protein